MDHQYVPVEIDLGTGVWAAEEHRPPLGHWSTVCRRRRQGRRGAGQRGIRRSGRDREVVRDGDAVDVAGVVQFRRRPDRGAGEQPVPQPPLHRPRPRASRRGARAAARPDSNAVRRLPHVRSLPRGATAAADAANAPVSTIAFGTDHCVRKPWALVRRGHPRPAPPARTRSTHRVRSPATNTLEQHPRHIKMSPGRSHLLWFTSGGQVRCPPQGLHFRTRSCVDEHPAVGAQSVQQGRQADGDEQGQSGPDAARPRCSA
jgi:hypothetical protein